MTNYERFYIRGTLGVVVSGFILAGFYFLTYAMLSCPYDDLNKCGIVVKENLFAIISREIDGKISLFGKVAALIVVAWVIWKFLASVEIVVASLMR